MNSGKDIDASEGSISPQAWTLLLAAASSLQKSTKRAAMQIGEGVPVKETPLWGFLPRRFSPRYDVAFAHRLSRVTHDLLQRLERARERGSQLGAGFLNSVAEEMLMSEAIRGATHMAGSGSVAEELEALEDVCFEDRDFEWLYDLRRDGAIDDPDVHARAGFGQPQIRRMVPAVPLVTFEAKRSPGGQD